MTGDAARLSRLERRRQATRQEILQAARELLLEVGPDELTLRQVARRADFSPAALYTYFSNREEIVASLLAESFSRLDAYIGRVPRGLSPEERVIQLGMAYMDFARDNPIDLRCILGATSQDLPPTSGRSVGLEAARLIGQTFRDGVEKGVFVPTRGQSAAEMAYGVWALVHGMVSLSGVDLGAVAEDVSAAPRRVLEAYVGRLTAGQSGTL
jgi:AcrR family transcriptional regulator